jgi:GATA-binding protein, other eukaryote
MDSLQFDAYTSYSDSSAPRTPSPRTSVSSDEMQSFTHSPAHYKQPLDIDAAQNIFADYAGDDSVVPETHSIESVPFWPGTHLSSPPAHHSSRGSLLQELYEPDIPSAHEMYMDQHSAERPSSGHSDWSQMSHEQNVHMHAQQHQQLHHHQVHMHRRNTFPLVRHDRENAPGSQQFFNPPFVNGDHGPMGPYSSRPDTIYGEPMPFSAEPSALHGSRLDEPFLHSMNSSPRGPYREFDHLEEGVKLEDAPPVIVPSQTAFYRPPTDGAMHPMSMSYLSPHTGLPVQHTDDAASKETQYLRRRCFNCHTTEPPSWRRSTLNPGKIVCNKCGLYERTHLRPRPLRFDELRAGNKARKQTKGVNGSQSPKQKLGGLVKKEPREFGLIRRSSVSSTTSSVHSGTGATSDWDDNGALRVVMYRRQTD